MLDGYPVQQGVRDQSPRFYQGEDVRLSFYLNYNGAPVDTDKHHLEAIVKKSPSAVNVLWKGRLNDGLYHKKAKGDFYILMPDSASSLFLPGTYYLDIKLSEKSGEGEDVTDITAIILSTTFTLELTAASPNPKLAANKSEEVSYDASTGITTIKITSVEPTLPKHTDKG